MSRPKGSKNKAGAEVKSQLLACYERLGGLKAFAEWAQEHRSDYYRMYAQLAPKEVLADVHVHSEVDLTDDELATIATGGGESVADPATGEADAPELH